MFDHLLTAVIFSITAYAGVHKWYSVYNGMPDGGNYCELAPVQMHEIVS